MSNTGFGTTNTGRSFHSNRNRFFLCGSVLLSIIPIFCGFLDEPPKEGQSFLNVHCVCDNVFTRSVDSSSCKSVSNLISFYVVEVGFTKTKKFGFFRYYAINLTEMQDVNVTTQQISVDTVSVTVYNYYNSLVGPHNVYFFVSEASGTETSLDDLSPQQITIYQDTSGKISERNLIAWKC